jgi:hypothetical protein
MIKPRCLIWTDGGTGSFPGDFVELEKWFRQRQRRVGLPDNRISPRVIFCSRCMFNPLRDEPILARAVSFRRR